MHTTFASSRIIKIFGSHEIVNDLLRRFSSIFRIFPQALPTIYKNQFQSFSRSLFESLFYMLPFKFGLHYIIRCV